MLTTGATNTAFGDSALLAETTGSGNVGIGYSAGKHAVGSNELYIDNQDRTNAVGDKAGALLYGVFDASPSNQTLTVNAALTVAQTLTVMGGISLTRTCNMAAANPTFVGGILTGCTAADAAPTSLSGDPVAALKLEVAELRALVAALLPKKDGPK